MVNSKVLYWGMYDLANTIFSALFVTFFFPFYVKHFLGGTEFQIGLVFGLSMLFVGIIVPFVGAWSDSIGKRMPFIIFFTLFCSAATWLVARVSLTTALFAGFIANFTYHAALATYNALLPKVAKKKEFGWVSGVGIAMGYLGTLVSLGIAALLLSRLGWESEQGAKAVFIATAVMFVLFSLPTFFGIREKKTVKDKTGAVKRVLSTFRNITKHRKFFRFLLSMFFYANAMNAAIVFLFLYARQVIQLSVKAFFLVYVVQSLGAVVGSFAAGKLTDKVGAKKVLIWAGFGWLAVLGLLLAVEGLPSFIVAGTLGGAMLGTVWTAMRPKLLNMVERAHVGQFFGFLELTDKFSGVFGPIVFGFFATYVNYTVALLSMAVFFVAGLWTLTGVPGDNL